MRHTNQCNNILCLIFCKHLTTNSKFFITLLFFLCSLECISNQNLNIQYTPGDQNGFLKDNSNELKNTHITNDKFIKSQNLEFLEERTSNQQDSVKDVTKENKVDLTIPRDYNYFLYDAELYLAEPDTRVRRTPFTRKKPSRPIQQHIRKPRPYIATTEKIANNDDDDDEEEEEEDDDIVGEHETYDEEKEDEDEEDEEDEESEKDEDNEDYDDQGRDCETSERYTETEPCETTESCETTELCETTTEECTEPPTDCATEEITTTCPENNIGLE